MLCVYGVHMDRWFRCYDVSDDVMKTKHLIFVEDLWEIICAESNGHLIDDITQPYDLIVVTYM